MTSLDPQRPLRDPTPEERRKAGRMVWLILLGLPSIIGVMVAYLTFRGRAVRDYGHEVYVVASQRPFPAGASGAVPCSEYLNKPLPAGALSCEVQFSGSKAEVLLRVEGDRQYRIER